MDIIKIAYEKRTTIQINIVKKKIGEPKVDNKPLDELKIVNNKKSKYSSDKHFRPNCMNQYYEVKVCHRLQSQI